MEEKFGHDGENWQRRSLGRGVAVPWEWQDRHILPLEDLLFLSLFYDV